MSVLAGARWDHKIDLADIFGDDTVDFEDRRDRTVKRLRTARLTKVESWERDILLDLLDALGDAENPDDYDDVFSEIYDWADDNRVWIATC